MVKDKWLIAESVDGVKQYIIHTEYPRFIAEILDGKDGQVIGNPEWIDRVSPEKSVKHRKSVFACIICQNPKQKEIEKVISSKKDFQTWGVVLKKLKNEFKLHIKAPQILIGHMKHRS